MNKKLILLFLVSFLLFSFFFYKFFLQRNKDKVNNNNSQKFLIKEENNEEEKDKEELNNKDENKEENLNNSQENKESKEEIEEPMKISNYLSILIIVVFFAIILHFIIFDIEEKDRSNWQKNFFNFFTFIASVFYKMSRIEFFLPLKVISWFYGFKEISEKNRVKSKEAYKIKNEEEQKKIFKGLCSISFHIFEFLFEMFINIFLFSLISIPFLIVANGLKNFKKRFRWKYLITSPFLFFRQGNILMKIMLILLFLFVTFISFLVNFIMDPNPIIEYYFLEYLRTKKT